MAKWILGVLLWLFIAPTMVIAADFYLHFEKCKITVGYLLLSDESLKTFDGDGSLTSCTRKSQAIHCEFEFPEGSKGNSNSDEYKVRIESPPLLIFTNEAMSDYYVIDQVAHAVTLITRVTAPQFAGAKVCQGTYLTESERLELKKSPEQRER